MPDLELPRYMHHPQEKARRVATQEEYDALVADDADWHPWPWSDDDKAAWQASRAQAEEETPSEEGAEYTPRRRR
jgi:hypothetical protein